MVICILDVPVGAKTLLSLNKGHMCSGSCTKSVRKKQVVEFKAKAKQKQSKNEAIVKHSRRIVFKTF